MAAINNKAKDDAVQDSTQDTVVKQADLNPVKLRKFIKVPAQLAGAYMGAHFDDEGKSTSEVGPDIIDALKNQFPGIQIQEIDGPPVQD